MNAPLKAAMSLPVRVTKIEALAPTLKRFTFEARHGGELPTPAPGAHVLLTLRDGGRVMKNAYSLVSPSNSRARYQIIVRHVAQSRGGSRFLHQQVKEGDELEIGMPVNLFPLASKARKHLLIGGGIGITPLLSFLPALRARGALFEMHQLCAGEEAVVFDSLLEAAAAGDNVQIHGSGRAGFDLAGILARQPLGTHLYACGPRALMEAVSETAGALGWPPGKVHKESFGDAAGGLPFKAFLARSGIEVDVSGNQTLLEAIEAAGVDAPCLCRGGACGECRVVLLEGEAEHRDDFLSPEEKAAQDAIMLCVSRARGARIVLDL